MSAITSQITGVSIVQAQIKENTKAPRRVTGLCVCVLGGGGGGGGGASPVTGEFPAQRASNVGMPICETRLLE